MSSLREREITCVHVCGPSHDHCVSLTCRRADVHGRAGDAGACGRTHVPGGEEDEYCLHAKDKTWRGPRRGLTDPRTNTLVTYDRSESCFSSPAYVTTGSKSECLQSSVLLHEDIYQLIFIPAILTACFG